MTARTERPDPQRRIVMVSAAPAIANGADMILSDALARNPQANLTAELDAIFAAGVVAVINSRKLPRIDSNPDEDA
jgi:hypothetical protein